MFTYNQQNDNIISWMKMIDVYGSRGFFLYSLFLFKRSVYNYVCVVTIYYVWFFFFYKVAGSWWCVYIWINTFHFSCIFIFCILLSYVANLLLLKANNKHMRYWNLKLKKNINKFFRWFRVVNGAQERNTISNKVSCFFG